ncbi:TPA: hypothetical protein MDR63_000818 [Klebsiella quasipneumoniae]|nr:hypothetical protein [Klebsiella quasipneumoniae]
MKERGMIFNSEMVRAILDGRKTQTRRIMKVQPKPSKSRPGDFWFSSKKLESMVHVSDLAPGNSPIADYHLFIQEHCCPFGAVGDRIWVRETFAALEPGSYEQVKPQDGHCQDLRYAATDRLAKSDADIRGYKWVPSIHMPRWASRILLEITDVRVERLNAISQADAIAEGAPPSHPSIDCVSQEYGFPDFSRSWFGQTWQHIYGEESWDANPWVWVIEFKRVEGGAA